MTATATLPPPEEGPRRPRLRDRAKLRASKVGHSILSGFKYVGTKFGRGTKKTATATGHAALATVRAAVFAVQWTLGAIGTVLFGTVRLLFTVVAFLITVLVVGVFMIGVALTLGLAYAQYGVDKYLLGTSRWLTFNAAHKEMHGSYSLFIHDRLEAFWHGESSMWGRRMLDFLSADNYNNERLPEADPGPGYFGEPMPSRSHLALDDQPPVAPEPLDTPSADASMEERAAHARWVGRAAEYAAQDQLFEEKVEMILESDKEDPDSAFPGAEAYITYEPDARLNFEIEEFGKYFKGIGQHGDIRTQDFSQFDDHTELLTFYRYMADSSRGSGNLRNSSYWEGRALMLDAFMKDSEVLDKSGRTWALIYQRFAPMQQEYSLRYMRTGFVDEMESISKRRNRHQATRSETADA